MDISLKELIGPLANLGALATVVVVYLVLQARKTKNGNGKTTGDTSPDYWLVILNDIRARQDTILQAVKENREQLNAIRSHLHDLRNLLAPLTMAVEILTEEIKKR